MSFLIKSCLSALVVSFYVRHAHAFQPCPILGPRFPMPSGLALDNVVQAALEETTTTFDDIVATGNSSYGPITTNTTSFSIALFTAMDELDQCTPFFYEYHHVAPLAAQKSQAATKLDAHSVFRLSTVTEVFTVWIFLAEAGEIAWTEAITKYLPELAMKDDSDGTQWLRGAWEDVTLGDLAGHLAGIPRDSGPMDNDNSNSSVLNIPVETSPGTRPSSCVQNGCTRSEFLADLRSRPFVYLPVTTPIYSNVAFQLLAYALEGIKSESFENLFNETMLKANLSESSLHQPLDSSSAAISGDLETSGWFTDLGDGATALGMYSTIADMSRAGIAMLNSTLLPSATTRRWFKPVADTSNLANDAGRPWIIFSATADQDRTNPVIEVFTSYGSIGRYSSYFGLVPDYNVGFTVLAVDSESAPDLNAHADIVAELLLPALEKAAITQAGVNFAGVYTAASSSNATETSEQVTLVIDEPDGLPGLSLANLTAGDIDIRAQLAELNGVSPTALSIRLYPTNLKTSLPDGMTKQAFRAVFQDEDALVDAGTPTCVTWLTVDALMYNGKPLDLLVFTLDSNGAAIALELPALGLDLRREPISI